FYVQTTLTDWTHTAPYPRRVGVSSFGAGGSNAHLILEEYAEPEVPPRTPQATAPELFVLSAKNPDALCRYAESAVTFLNGGTAGSLADVAYTSQVGRAPMDARLALVASSVEDLRDKLTQWIAPRRNTDIHSGSHAAELESIFYGDIRDA